MTAYAPNGILVLGLVGGRQVMTTIPSVDPTAGGGVAAPVGSIYLRDDGTLYTKTAAGNTAWTALAFGNGVNRFALPELWAQQDVVASQTAVALSCSVSTNFDSMKMMRTGSVTGLSTRLTTAITAGTLSVVITKNGTAGTLAVAHTSVSNASGGQTTQAIGIDTFVAGDLIGVKLTTNGAFLPITDDLEAWVEIQETV